MNETNLLLSRRNLLLGSFGLSVATLTPGCAHLLLRLFVGRGAAGMLTRSAGAARLGATFGRGVATGSVVARQAIPRAVGGQTLASRTTILRPNGSEIARTLPERSGTYTTINGSKVLYSKRIKNGYDHQAQERSAGRSVNHSDGWVEHTDRRGRRVGFDQVNLARRVIRHLDKDQNTLGETRFTNQQDRVFLESDPEAIAALDSLANEMGLNCPDAKRALDEWHANQRICQNTDTRCRLNSIKRDRYFDALKRCQQRKN